MRSPEVPAMNANHRGLATGIGWRHPHYRELLAQRPGLAFLEVHSENFFADGGAPLAVLEQGRAHYPVSLHGVGLSLGSAIGLDEWHLERLASLVQRIDPVRVSDHASFARAPLAAGMAPVHGADLLPLAFTEAGLQVLADNVQRVQDRLRRPILVENLSVYLRWADDAIPEAEFFSRLARRTGCGMLLDVNNLAVNALNAGEPVVESVLRVIEALDPGIVGEIHLAGFSKQAGLVVDDHSSPVHAPVWQAYAQAVRRFGPVPTLIEWDTDIPALEVLLAEAATAQRVIDHAAMAAEPA